MRQTYARMQKFIWFTKQIIVRYDHFHVVICDAGDTKVWNLCMQVTLISEEEKTT